MRSLLPLRETGVRSTASPRLRDKRPHRHIKSLIAGTVLLLASLVTGAMAQKMPRYPIDQFRLKNGMRVVLSEDHSVPVIGLALAYDVGSRSEVKGRTGFAHLFEHMMFQGTPNVPKGKIDKFIGGAGGTFNGFTRDEATTYIESFPAEKLPLILWLEADRMRALNINAENLKNQQEVVKEEKRLRYDNQPYANARQRVSELAYSNFANQHSTIGLMEDLDAANLSDVQSFFKTYYAPNNATLVLVGDFDPKVTRKLLMQYFEDIPRQPDPPRTDVTEPKPTSEKRETVVDPLARVPAILMAWHSPSLGSQDACAMDLLHEVLFSGESSRGYQEIVKKNQLALAVQGGAQAQRGPSLYNLFVITSPFAKPDVVEKAVYSQIENLIKNPPTSEELARVKTRFRANRLRGFSIFGMESMLGRAIQISDYALFRNDPNLINTELAEYMSVTPQQIVEVAKKYLTPENRTVVLVKPGSSARPSPGGKK